VDVEWKRRRSLKLEGVINERRQLNVVFPGISGTKRLGKGRRGWGGGC